MASVYADRDAGGGADMAVGRVLARAFGAIKDNPVLFLGVGAALSGLPLLLGLVMPTPTPAPGAGPLAALRILPTFGLVAVVWLVVYVFAHALLLRAGVAGIDRRPDTPGGYAGVAARRLLPLLGLGILLTLGIWAGMVLLLVPGVILAVMWSVAAPALVNEPIGVIAAFGRSRYLTKGARWRVFGLLLLVFAVYFVLALAFGLGTAAFRGFGAQAAIRAAPTAGFRIASFALQTAFVAIWTATLAALYVELRDWKDGPAGSRLAEIFA